MVQLLVFESDVVVLRLRCLQKNSLDPTLKTPTTLPSILPTTSPLPVTASLAELGHPYTFWEFSSRPVLLIAFFWYLVPGT